MRRVIAIIAVVLIGSVAGALAYAPYLPQLIGEGFPPLVLPKAGQFAPVEGSAVPRSILVADHEPTHTLPADVDAFFTSYDSQALLLYRDGHLAVEHYADGVDADTRFNSYSMAKSLIALMVLRAVGDGRIASLDVTLGTLLPGVGEASLELVTLRSLLAMKSGIAFDNGSKFGGEPHEKDIEAALNPFGPLARLHFMGLGAIEDGLAADTVTPPVFSYQNVNTALLGAVLEKAYGEPLPQLLARTIWQPAGAAPALWRRPAAGQPVTAYCCVYATARDWIRVGLYVVENGTPEQPLLPEPLWREFLGLDLTHDQVRTGFYSDNTYHDVLDRAGQALQGQFAYMFGQDGQTLYMMPDKGVVAYRAGKKTALLHSMFYGAFNASAAAQ